MSDDLEDVYKRHRIDHIHLHLGTQWRTCGQTTARGYAFSRNMLLNTNALAKFFEEKSPGDMISALLEVNGFFAIVQSDGISAFAAVDRMRSMPIFYAQANNDVHISDDCQWLAEQFPKSQYDALSVVEFALTGYVTGNGTLDARVKQLQAGELLFVKQTSSGISVRTERYYRYLHHDYVSKTEEALVSDWDEVLVNTFQRLIKSVNNCTIVIPLSGGHDSRLIAVMLRRLGYEKVICFSYGIPGNWESNVSKQVAHRLNYRWEFVPYSHELWDKWFHSEEHKSCARSTEGLTSVALMQDWPAVWTMENRGILPEDSVIVPGHSGDFLAGSHIPEEFHGGNRKGLNELVQVIMRYHYNLWDPQELNRMLDTGIPIDEVLTRLKEKIRGIVVNMPCETPEDAVNAYEYWDWQERQCKFIVNSVRAYESLGYRWRLPLWDSTIMSFWERVPLHYRLRKGFYDSYVEKTQSTLGIQQPPHRYLYAHYMNRILEKTGLLEPVTKIGLHNLAHRFVISTKRLSYKREYKNHPLGWYGIISIEQFGRLYSLRPDSIYSLLVLARLGMIS